MLVTTMLIAAVHITLVAVAILVMRSSHGG